LLDFSTENIYSDYMGKLVSWHRCYDSFWKNSALYCDLLWPSSDPAEFHSALKDMVKFWNAVTGKNWDFLEGIKVGRRIWNLDNAIWTLQGRHRDMVHFADYIYEVPYSAPSGGPIEELGFNVGYYGPGKENGKWKYLDFCGRKLDKDKFEEFKTRFYKLEGWDSATGWPTRSTLESIGLGYIADELKKHGRLGKG
jgi:aldehyde:ferredoxin oxidoreductase